MASTFLKPAGRRPATGVLLMALALVACGGGGGGSSPAPAAEPGSVSGIVMLGPVANADVVVRGTRGELGRGQTGSDGRFGPIQYAASYSGPIRIEVSGNASSTWTCDFFLGCEFNDSFYNLGDAVPFDGRLEAVLPFSSRSQFVNVSLLSDLASKRTNVLGGLSTDNVTAAHSDILDLVGRALTHAIASHELSLPARISSVPLFDIANPPRPDGNNDATSAVLSLFNSALTGLSTSTQSTGEFTESFSQAIAARPVLPVSALSINTPSLESLTTAFLVQLYHVRGSGNDELKTALNRLLSPGSVRDLYDSAVDTFLALPSIHALRPAIEQRVFFNDSKTDAPLSVVLPVVTSTGTHLGLEQIAVIESVEPGNDWMDSSFEIDRSQLQLRLRFDNLQMAALDNGTHFAHLYIYSPSGDFLGDSIPIELNVNLSSKLVDAGPDFTIDEQLTTSLQASTNRPAEVQRVSWTQTSGPAITFDNPAQLTPAITLPALDTEATATLRLDIEHSSGALVSDYVTITISDAPLITDQQLPDTALQQCIDSAASDGELVETVELLALNCAGVSSLDGLDVFTGLLSLQLPASTLTSAQALLALQSLAFLDVSASADVPCAEIDELASRLEEGVSLLVNSHCKGTVLVDLPAEGFDMAVSHERGQIYISLPSLNEIAVLAIAEPRIVERIALDGSPYGLDIALDGTRLFAALRGSDAVAVIDIDGRTVDNIPLAGITASNETYDVIEGAPGRLFVSATSLTGRTTYIAQVRLDQANLVSRTAGEALLSENPRFARSPLHDALYVISSTPGQLSRLDLLASAAPVVLHAFPGNLYGVVYPVVSSDGSRLALSSGQVLNSDTLGFVGAMNSGATATGVSANSLHVAVRSNTQTDIASYDFLSVQRTSTTSTACPNTYTRELAALADDSSFALLQADVACLHTTLPRTTGSGAATNQGNAMLPVEN